VEEVCVLIEFGYKQFTTTHYVSTNKLIHVYFSHMTYLISYVTSLNNTWHKKVNLAILHF
jgi:hypothetical protein